MADNSLQGEHGVEWTIGTLKSHMDAMNIERDHRFEQRFEGQKTALEAAMAAAQEAVKKAELATEKRFDSVNEFRATLADQSASFLPRNEYNARHDEMQGKLELLRVQVEKVTTQMYGFGVGADQTEHQQQRSDSFRVAVPALVISGLVALISVASLIVALSHHHA